MTRKQVGCPGSWDTRQKKRDDRRLKEENAIKVNEKKSKYAEEELKKRSEVEIDENENDPTFEVKEWRVMKKMIDVMSKISLTCDGRNVSGRSRIAIAASVANALHVDIIQTNISKTTAWRKGHEARLKQSKEIKDNFKCPDRVVVHGVERR